MASSPGHAPRLLLVDNVDSFSFMLADTLRSAGADVTVERNDAADVALALGPSWDAVVISPGPGRVEDAGSSLAITAACIDAGKPLLGVCLGHQAIALACGARVERTAPVHGKVARIAHDGSGLFAGQPSPFDAARYHSLGVRAVTPPLVANAWSDDGEIMGLRHIGAPVHGLQFHPESIATPLGVAILRAFVIVAASA